MAEIMAEIVPKSRLEKEVIDAIRSGSGMDIVHLIILTRWKINFDGLARAVHEVFEEERISQSAAVPPHPLDENDGKGGL